MTASWLAKSTQPHPIPYTHLLARHPASKDVSGVLQFTGGYFCAESQKKVKFEFNA